MRKPLINHFSPGDQKCPKCPKTYNYNNLVKEGLDIVAKEKHPHRFQLHTKQNQTILNECSNHAISGGGESHPVEMRARRRALGFARNYPDLWPEPPEPAKQPSHATQFTREITASHRNFEFSILIRIFEASVNATWELRGLGHCEM